ANRQVAVVRQGVNAHIVGGVAITNVGIAPGVVGVRPAHRQRIAGASVHTHINGARVAHIAGDVQGGAVVQLQLAGVRDGQRAAAGHVVRGLPVGNVQVAFHAVQVGQPVGGGTRVDLQGPIE